MQKKEAAFKLFFLWWLPVIWMMLAIAGLSFKGGENLTAGVSLAPGLVINHSTHWVTLGALDIKSGNVPKLLAEGLLLLFVAGLILDFAAVRLKYFLVCWIFGFLVSLILLSYAFFNEAFRSSFSRAINLFNLDQPERVVALGILAIAFAFYIGIALAPIQKFISWNLAQNEERKSKPAKTGKKVSGKRQPPDAD